MPDTPIDLSEGIQSVRLKVPTAEVPIPPEGFAQLHSPAPGELALRLPDGSVAAVGGGGGGGGAATSVLGPGGAIDAANSDPQIGININAAPGTGIGFTGRFLDQFAKPLGVQVEAFPVSSAELLALDTVRKVLVPGVAARVLIPIAAVLWVSPGSTPYAAAAPVLLAIASRGPSSNERWLRSDVTDALTSSGYQPAVPLLPDVAALPDMGNALGGALVAYSDNPVTAGDGTARLIVWYSAVA